MLMFGVGQLLSQNDFSIGANLGGAKLLGEVPVDFSKVINEFDNKTGLVYSLDFTKHLSQHWELGTEFSYSILKGNTDSPNFSAEGVQAGIPNIIEDPVEYLNKLSGVDLFFNYYIKTIDSKSLINPFFKAGVGYLNYNSRFKYVEAPENELLFGKGMDGYTNLSTPVFILGSGIKTSLTSKLNFKLSFDFNMVNYDFLDVIHNYDQEQARLETTGIYTEIKFGMYYLIDNPFGNKKGKKGKRNSNSNDSYLPFSP